MNTIDTYVEANLQRYINEIIELCAQPSVSATGQGIQECAALTAKILWRHGLDVQTFTTAGNPIIVGRASGKSKRTILLYNHYDVQPPEPLDLWTSPPFQPEIREGYIFARGVSDDKGDLISRLAAIDALRDIYHGDLPCSVTFVVEGEEEIGSPHVSQFVSDHLDLLKSQGAIWEVGGVGLDGSTGTSLGVRGILSVELSVETMNRDAHSGSAHFLPSAAWKLVWALASLKSPNDVILIPGIYDNIVPPTSTDLEILANHPDNEKQVQEMAGIDEFIGGLSGMELRKAVFKPTCNIQGIQSGYQRPGIKTMIPARASVKIDFRLVPNMTPDDVEFKLRDHLNRNGFKDITVTRMGAMYPYKAAGDDPLFHLASKMAEQVYGQPLRIDTLGGGSSPIYSFAGPLGNIPVIWAGVGGPNGNAHSPDENISIKNFINGTRYISRILDGFSTLP